MREFLWLMSFLVFAGLADKSIAYILMRGSIFEWLRQAIEQRKDRGSWLFSKLYDLFSCNLCMTAQVAIWFFAVPLAIVTWGLHPLRYLLSEEMSLVTEVFLTFFTGFLLAMAIAAVAKAMWEAFEYLPARAEAEALYRAKIVHLVARIAQNEDGDLIQVVSLLAETPARAQLRKKFWDLWENIAQRCDPLDCIIQRRVCVQTIIRDATSWSSLMPGVSLDKILGVLMDMDRARVSYKAYERSEVVFQDFCERLGI